jgi:hypothetical protein
MSTEQEKFFTLLNQYPNLAVCWNEQKREIRPRMIIRTNALASTGEKVILACLQCIWYGQASDSGTFIDITQLAQLSDQYKRPIVEWLINPFWP